MARKKNQSVALPSDKGAISDSEHSMLITWVNESEDATEESRDLAEKSRNYYDSEQWTDSEKAKLSAQKQAATVINRIKPKIDSLMGMERANRTTAKAFPRTPKETGGAQAATESVRFVLQDNFYDRQRSDSWENILIEGTGGLEIRVDKKNLNKILIKHIMWDRIIYDPHSRRKDFSDARYLGQVVWMDFDEAVEKYPQAKDVLESMQHSKTNTYDDKPRWMDNTRRRVKIVELYYRKNMDWWYACFTRGGYCEEPKVSPYVNEEGETEHVYEFASPFVDREGNRYGAIKQLLDIQDEINKRRSKALHLMSVRQVRWEKGAVPDINEARRELAKPDGVIETTPGMEFEVLKTGDMAQAQFNLLAEAKMEIDAVGANAATVGKDKTVQSGVALRQRALTGQTELAPMFDVLKNLDLRVYRKVWNRIKQYWTSEMWLRVTDDENNLQFVGLNQPVVDPLTGKRTIQNPVSQLDVDIVMADAPDTVTQEVEDFQAMAEMVKSGFPLPPEAVIEASPLSNKDKIIKLMKQAPQMSPEHQKQMEDMGNQIKKLSEENQKMKMDKSESMIELELKAKELEMKAKIQAAELQLEREKAAAQIEIEKMKAGAQVELQGMKMSSDQQIQKEKLAFDQQCRMEDEAHKVNTEVGPQVVGMLQNGFGQAIETLAKMLEESMKLNREVLQAVKAPKDINLQFSNGTPVGATVRTLQ